MPDRKSPTITVCAVQPAVTWNEPEQTFAAIAELVAQATAQGPVDIVLLPEHFNATREIEGETRQFQAAAAFSATLARSHRVNLIAGSIEHDDPQRRQRFNVTLAFDRSGREVARYHKRMLFGVEKRRHLQPGSDAVVVRLDGARCGILICSDLWHPELVRDLAPTIDLLCVPAQTTIRAQSEPAYARLLWHSLAMTRAQENVIAVAVSDSAADSVAPFRCGGVTSITDPGAEPDIHRIQRVLADGRSGFLMAEIDLERLDRFRQYRRQNGLLPEEAG